jgi:phage gpG-like protein
MIEIALSGDKEVIAKLDALPSELRFALAAKIFALTQKLRTNLIEHHLSGPTGPHSLSVGQTTSTHTAGQLRQSVIAQPVEASETEVSGGVAYGANTPYAAIHEFGGTINIPDIFPKKAQALHFIQNGEDVFYRHVRAHTVTIPERAPLRTAFDEMKSEIIDEITETVKDVIG